MNDFLNLLHQSPPRVACCWGRYLLDGNGGLDVSGIEKSGGVSEEPTLSAKANRWSATAAGIVRAALHQPEGE